MDTPTEDQLQEYESQLADVVLLLEDSPNDEQLLSLKQDIDSLIHLTKESLPGRDDVDEHHSADNNISSNNGLDKEADVEVGQQLQNLAPSNVSMEEPISIAANNEMETGRRDAYAIEAAGSLGINSAAVVSESQPAVFAPPSATATIVSEKVAHKKKTKNSSKIKMKNYEIPQHLIPLETDSVAEKNRKRRASKALKNKWREKKKEAESNKKQKTWQSFQQKRKTKKDTSIFATQDGETKVGVSSGRTMTEFNERTRHTY